MSFSVDVVNLILYSAQQLGVMLGVGSASILLVAYLVSIHDGTIDPKEEQFGRAVTKVQTIGLWIIILSGLAITAIHISGGALDIVLSPAFLFKWVLIGLLFGASLFRQSKPYPNYMWEGVIGANWYSLFIVHILAPVALWSDLIIIYIVWNVGFILCYAALFHALRAPSLAPHQEKKFKPVIPIVAQKKIEVSKPIFKPASKPVPPQPKPIPPQPKPVLPPPVQPNPLPPKPIPPPPVVIKPLPPPMPPMPERPHAPLPVVAQTHELSVPPPVQKAPPVPTLEVPHKPPTPVPIKPAPIKPTEKIVDPDENPGLPAIRVMPRTAADVDKQNRASTVQF